MALSSWPEDWKDDAREPRRDEIVTVIFEESLFVKINKQNGKAILLVDDPDCKPDVAYWIPKSQIGGDTPEADTWIDNIEIPRWLADEEGLDYE